jgi:hypothetical protein
MEGREVSVSQGLKGVGEKTEGMSSGKAIRERKKG